MTNIQFNMCQYISKDTSNQTTPKHEFNYGYNEMTQTQQMIAFWTHTIDTFASILEHDTNIYVKNIAQTTLQTCGTDSTYAYMGGVRAGFQKSIQSLPDEIRVPVETYFEGRMNEMKTDIPDDVSEIDFVLGVGDPFRYE